MQRFFIQDFLTSSILKNYFLLLLLLSCAVACVPTSATTDADKKYFDLVQFTDNQVHELYMQKPQVKKKIFLDGQTDQITSDTLNWEKELALFREADINSPSLRDSYEISEDKIRHTLTYTAKESKLKVKEIKLVFDEQSHTNSVSVRQVKIFFSEDNQLYEIQRDLSMELKNNLLSAYSIKGFQKVILKDSLIYEISATLNQPNNQ